MVAAVALSLTAALPAQAAGQAVLIAVDPQAQPAELHRRAGARLVEHVGPGIDLVGPAPGRSLRSVLDRLRRDPAVLVAEPDRPIEVAGADPLFSLQWGLENSGAFRWAGQARAGADVDAAGAWQLSTGEGVTVAVADTGVDQNHLELAGRLSPGWDYVDDDSDPQDHHGHGTHVAGVILARHDNGEGVSGLAPDATVMPLRVLDGAGKGLTSHALAAYADAIAAGARIINASFGSSVYSAAEDLFITENPQTLFVVAAGNLGSDLQQRPKYPCALPHPNVVCVGASAPDDAPAAFSNFGGAAVDLFAPGVDIVSTWPGGHYAFDSGTSMAAPFVAATAALVRSRYPQLQAADLRSALVEGADALPELSGLSVGGGRLNATGALEAGALISEAKGVAGGQAEPVAVTEQSNPKPASPALAPVAQVEQPEPAAPLQTVAGLRVSGHARTRQSRAGVLVSLTGVAKIKLRLQRRTCKAGRCSWRTVHSWGLAGAGSHRISLRGRTRTAGRWRVAAVIGAQTVRSAQFRVES